MASDSLRPHDLYSPWNSLGQNTGVGSLSLLQGTFPTQGLNPGLLHCRRIFYHLSYQGNPRVGPCWLSILYIVCVYANPRLLTYSPLPHISPLFQKGFILGCRHVDLLSGV